ncbi:uncharacterized protein LOC112451852, partial [Temnothorax curvispinosus]|uniref:Uncharacterized protein LOC112451852 n=1 Tax=Temnothorax curvispinosus TaxID=300111 RepID=A0A6J1PDQ2_9HYME
MSEDLSALLAGQHDIQGRISRSVENMKKMGMANINLSAVETRIHILDQLWEKFEAQHEQLRNAYKDKYNDSEYVKSDLFDITENTYVQQRSVFAEYANSFRLAPSKLPQSSDQSDRAPKTSLPRLQLKKFLGAYEDWPPFRDLFLSVIGDAAISNVERFHYLRSCLQGPAETLIRPLFVTGENYDRAWAILSKHYKNKKELIRSNFAAFTAVAKMKGDTADELSRIHHAVTTAVNAQESIGRPILSHGMDLFNFLVVEMFDPRTRLEWESYNSNSLEPPEHETLTDFISKRILTLKAAKPKSNQVSGDSTQSAKSHFAKQDNAQCAMCKGKHALMLCPEFKAKSANERKSFVDTNRLCYNCLGNHLIAKCQSTQTCLTCKARHHSTLHEAYTQTKPPEASVLSAVQHADSGKATLLATARVIVADRYGDPRPARALIDQGSEVSIISEALVQRLLISRVRSSLSILGVGGSKPGATKGKVKLDLTSAATGARLNVEAFILPRLSLYRGPSTKRTFQWSHFAGLQLADPQFLANDPVELLLGAEVCAIIFEDGLRKNGPSAPIAQKTSLGWILSGGRDASSPEDSRCSLLCTIDHDLVDLVRRFWEQEKEPSSPAALTPDEERCEDLFVRTHTRTATGRYVVRLPFVKTPPSLAETRKPAERLLNAMERKGARDSRFEELYRSFIQEYEDLQHMEPVNPSENNEPNTCYLPHHGVFRESSSTTKLRVVFNGSQRTGSGDSLNDHLLAGPNLLPNLADVLLRWRRHRFVLI